VRGRHLVGLAGHGVRRGDPSTWTEPVVRVACPEGGPFIEAGTSRLLQEACDQLLAPGRWWRRQGVGGQAGDVFLCHQLTAHSASWPHRGRVPRLMAQPSVALLGEYRLPGLPVAPPTPVEEAVLRALDGA